MNYILLLTTFICYFHICCGLFENSTIIVEVNFEELKEKLFNNDYVLVIFYSTKCHHCKKLVPFLISGAEIINSLASEIIILSINNLLNFQVVREFDVSNSPTIKMFINRKPNNYDIEYGTLSFVRWALKLLTDNPIELHKSSYIKDLSSAENYLLIGFFEDRFSEECQLFQQVASLNEKLNWVIVTSSKLFEEYLIKSKNHLLAIRKFDDPRVDFKANFTFDDIKHFIKTTSVPYLSLFYDRSAENRQVFDVDIENYIIGFIDSTHKKFTLHKMLFTKAAKQFVGKVKFIYTNVDDHSSSFLMNIFFLKKEDAPTYTFMKLFSNYSIITYRPADMKMTSKRVVEFTKKVLNGDIDPYYRSEKLHQRWNKYPVKVLVADNFEEVTKDDNLTVFVQFCALKCKVCDSARFILHELAMSYKDQPSVWIAIIDLDKNDLKDYKIDSFPEYWLFPSHSNSSFKYLGNRTIADFQAFINSNGSIHNKLNYTRVEETRSHVATYITMEHVYETMITEDLDLVLEEVSKQRY